MIRNSLDESLVMLQAFISRPPNTIDSIKRAASAMASALKKRE